MAEISKDPHVRKPNQMIQAGQSLTAMQQNILFSMLKRFMFLSGTKDIEDISKENYMLPIREVYPNFNSVKGGRAYDLVRGQVSQLVEQKLTYIDGKRAQYVPIFGFAEVVEGSSDIKVRFNVEVIPYLTNMVRSGYTNLVFKEVYELKSAYAKRLYELITLNRNHPKAQQTGSFEISIPDLRFKLGIDDSKYSRWCDLKNRIVDPSVEEITLKTSLRFFLKLKKNGRNIVALQFSDFVSVDQSVAVSISKDGEQAVLDFGEPAQQTTMFEVLSSSKRSIDIHPYLDCLMEKDRLSMAEKHSPTYIEYYHNKAKGVEKRGRLKSDFANCFYAYLVNDADKFYDKEVRKNALDEERRKNEELQKKATAENKSKINSVVKDRLELVEKAVALFGSLPEDVQKSRIRKLEQTLPFLSEKLLFEQASMNYYKEFEL